MVTIKEQYENFDRYNPLIATTYNFNYNVIKETIFPRPSYRERSIIITDKDEFNKVEQPQEFCNQGSSYYIYPATKISGNFHPKIAIGVKDEFTNILLGSHNLTESGIKYNLELTSFFEIPIINDYENTLMNISNFIIETSKVIPEDKIIIKEMNSLAKFITNYSDVKITDKYFEKYFLHSYKKSIIEQVTDIIPNIKKVIICSPTLSNNPIFIKKAIKICGGKAHFIIDPKVFSINNAIKKEYQKHDVLILKSINNRTLHAKLFVFKTDNGVWTLYGSPNFTENALMKNVSQGGNVETAILIPPTKEWSWESLFKKEVTFEDVSWNEIDVIEMESDNDSFVILVNKWGYETPDHNAIIYAPGLNEGQEIIVHLLGNNMQFRILINNGIIKFKIPPSLNLDTRYRITDINGNILGEGFINRSAYRVEKIINIDINDDSKILLWFFQRRLKNYEYYSISHNRENILPIIQIDPNLLITKNIENLWNPINTRYFDDSIDKLYNKCEKIYENKYYEYLEHQNYISLIELMLSIDLMIEGAYYYNIYTNGKTSHIVTLTKKLSILFNLPCKNNNQRWNDNWRSNYYDVINDNLKSILKKYGQRYNLLQKTLLLFWVYLHSKHIGRKAFQSRSPYAKYMVNKFYQIIKALEIMLGYFDSKGDSTWEDWVNCMRDIKILIPKNDSQIKDELMSYYNEYVRK